MTKTGIVFSGGGGKGAYEIGVWKALKEFGFDQNITAVSGTSVGGLNAALFAQGDYEKAEQLWLGINQSQILKLDSATVMKKVLGGAALLAIPGFQGKAALQLFSAFTGKGLFTQDGLEALIEQSGVCNNLINSNIPTYVCALKLPQGGLNYCDITQTSPQQIKHWLKATSAIPVIFPSVKIDGQKYCDGGVLPGSLQDNTPYQPLIDNHECTHIINIYLDRNPNTRSSKLNNPNITFWNLIPQEKFYGLIESLNFSAENAQALIDCGYEDTKAILLRFSEFLKTEERYIESVEDFSESSNKFQDCIEFNKKIMKADRFSEFLLLDDKLQSHELTTMEDKKEEAETFNNLVSTMATDLSAQEEKLIEHNVEQLVAEMKDNSADILEEAFTAISTLASTDGRINSQFEQGVLSRLWGGITGSNAKQQASINWDLNRAIYATQSLVQKLNHKQMLTMEAVAALSNKTNYLLTHVNLLHVKSQQQEQQQLEGLLMMKKGLHALANATDQRFSRLEDRVDTIEYKQLIDDWYYKNRQALNTSSTTCNLLSITSSFYKITEGNWTSHCLNRYQSLLDDLNLAQQEILWEDCLQENTLNAFVESLEVESIFPISPKKREFHSLLTQMQSAYEKTDLQLNEVDKTIQIKGKNLGLSLLYSLQRNDVTLNKLKSLKGEGKVDQLLNIIDEIYKLNESSKLSDAIIKEAEYLKRKITQFKVIIPVIGKFSAGKSTLLNTYLGAELLPSDINPETAVATELLYGETSKVLLHYKGGKVTEHSTEILTALPLENDLMFIQYFINNRKLKHRQNITIVDMPGFDSTLDAHHKAISAYLTKGDVFINIFPADIPFDDSIMQYLSELTYNYNKKVHCLLSKCSRFTATVLQEKKAELQEMLSLHVKENDLEKVVIGELESRSKNSINIKDFEDIIDEATSQYDQYLSARFEPLTSSLIDQVKQELTMQIALSNSGEAELNLQIKESESVFLQAQKEVEREISQFEYNLTSLGQERIANKAASALNNNIQQLVNAAKGNSLNEVINGCIRPVIQFELTQLVENELNKLQQKLDTFQQSEGSDVVVQISIPASEKEKFSISTSAICAGIGYLMLGPLGGIISSIIGGIFGRKDNEQEKEDQIRSEIQNQVIPTVITQVMQSVNDQLNQNVNQLKDTLNNALQEKKENKENKINALKEQLQKDSVKHEALITLQKESISSLSNQQKQLIVIK